jgi:tetratricopeptide (TPR) repeat protein
MILRLSNSAQRGMLVAAAFFISVALSYYSIRNARASYFAGLQTLEGCERSTRLEPGEARNWHLLGQYWHYNLEDANTPSAIRAYLAALSLNPRSTETWLDLAAAYESQGDLASARDAYLQAKKVYPLSAEVSWRYGNFLLRQGELESAFAEMRRAVEGDPKRAAEAFSRSLRVEPDAQKILDRVLPPVPDVYLDVMQDQTSTGHTENALRVWDRLAAMNPRLALSNVFALVGALRVERRIPEAQRVWNQAAVFAGLGDLPGPPGSILWDGGFESGVSGGGFSWIFPEGFRAVQFNLDAQEKHSGTHSLRLTFDGRSNVNFTGICHYVPVQPSTDYRFSAWERTRALTSDQGVRFQLRSLGTGATSGTVTPDVRGTSPWTRIEIPWSSGTDIHELQVCLARYPGEQLGNRIQGTAWIDDVALVPESVGLAKP